MILGLKRSILLLAFITGLFGNISIVHADPDSNENNYEIEISNAINTFEAELLKKEQSFTTPQDLNSIAWIQAKLEHMVEVDQFMRNFSMDYPKEHLPSEWHKAFNEQFTSFYQRIDGNHTEWMKKILKAHHWVTVSKFGKKADHHAWLLVQHADNDPDFQKEVLLRLEKLVDSKETNPTSFAYLFDRVAASYNDESKRMKQRYATQGNCIGKGMWEPLPVEDPENIDKIRASVGLGTLEEYKSFFKDICP